MRNFFTLNIFMFCIAALLAQGAFCEEAPMQRVFEAYPDLSRGILHAAQLAELPEEHLVVAAEKPITRQMLALKLDEFPEEMRSQAADYLFYVLEGMITEPILLTVILGQKDLPEDNDDVQQLFRDYIGKVIGDIEVTEDQARAFYEENRELVGEMEFEEIKDGIMGHLLNEKQQAVWENHVREMGHKTNILVNAAWVAEQAKRVLDNPVDKARAEDRPVVANFTADWCPACKMLKPVMEIIEQDFSDKAAILVIDTDESSFLAKRYEVQNIPLLIFFDKDGREVTRHTGFLSEERIIEKLKQIGAL